MLETVNTYIPQGPVGLHIRGESIITSRTQPITNRFSGERVGEVCEGTAEDVERAIDVAYEAYSSNTLTPNDFNDIMQRAARLTEERKDHIARVMALESGLTIKDALNEITRSIQTLILSGEEAKRIVGHQIPIQGAPGMENRLAFTLRVPVGVVAAITPFNAPFNNVCHKIAPAIAAGNTVVLKPAPATPLSALEAVRVLEDAGLPKGYVNVVFGGPEVGAALLADKRIGFYTFTGSAQVGEIIKRDSGLRRVALELGNNSASIVCADADLAKAAPLLVRGGYRKAGQVCVSVQRVYVERSVMSKLAELMKIEIAKLKVGDPLDPETDVGPLIDSRKADDLEAWIAEAVEKGAEIEAGGQRLSSHMFQPTLLSNGSQNMRVVCDEVFGPVVTLVPFDDFESAVHQVNDSPYGLQAGVFTKDLQKAFAAARGIKVGGININDTSNSRGDLMPYGGVKDSGIGREGPYYAIREMTDERLVVLNL